MIIFSNIAGRDGEMNIPHLPAGATHSLWEFLLTAGLGHILPEDNEQPSIRSHSSGTLARSIMIIDKLEHLSTML